MMMMTDQSTKNISETGRLSSKPRVIKLSRHHRHQLQKNQYDHSSTGDTRSNNTIHTNIGLSSRTRALSNPTESIISANSIEMSKNQRSSINENKTNGSNLSHSQSRRSQAENYNGKNILKEQSEKPTLDVKEGANNEELKKDRMTSATRMSHYQDITHYRIQTNNHSDLRTTESLSIRMNFPKQSRQKLNKKTKKRQKLANCCQCSRLCIFACIVAAILIGTALAAALISILDKSNTTTKLTTATTTTMTTVTTTTATTDTTTTTTTETTTITYVPTGVYALEIPTCATWNQTGITVASNANGTSGADIGSLNAPVSIFVDNNYTLYVCDRDNDRILKYVVNATIPVLVAGTGTPGNAPSKLNQPRGVAVDQMGAIIVGDTLNYRIQRFPLGSTVGTTIAINSSSDILGQTRDLHIDVNNAIYVTDSDYSRIVKFYPNDGIGVILAGSSGPGSAADQFSSPYGNFMDGNQTLYVADSGNARVQKWPAGATSGITVAGVTGSAGTSLAQLTNPLAVVVDNNGYVYVVDLGNNRIVRWTDNYASGGTCIVGCTGTAGVGATQLNSPRDLKFDPSGNLYVSDQGNNRVQKYMIQQTPNCTYTSG